jgi:folate-binding protein YgfZ
MLPTPLSGADHAAYEALHHGVIALARPDLLHLEFTGPKAAEALTGLVTNHVLALAEGEGQYAAALTAKGKIVADLRIVRIGAERYLTTTSDRCWPAWRDMVRKYVNPRLARYAEPALHTVSLFGPLAHGVADQGLAAIGATTAADAPPSTLAAYAPSTTVTDAEPAYRTNRYSVGDAECLRIATPALGRVPGVDLLLPPLLAERLLAELARDAAVTPGTLPALEVARIEAGRPQWGRDMDDNTIPQEANLGALGALSFDKGCYTGQETVARIHFRGHVNRHLRVLHSGSPMPIGAELRTADGKVVGDVRSSTISPQLGPIALAMVRREVEPGAVLHLHYEGQEPTVATVSR